MLAEFLQKSLWVWMVSLMVWIPGGFAQDEASAEVEVEVETVEAEATPETMEAVPAETAEAEGAESTAEEWELPVRLDDSVSIRKIYEFLNDPEITQTGKDRSLEYEFKYFNYGAVTEAQRYNREGQYYVVTWTNHGSPADYVLRLDYRQGKTREKVHTVEIPYPQAEGTFKGTLSVTGDDYHMDGNVLSWRISIVRNGTIVAEKKSFVW